MNAMQSPEGTQFSERFYGHKVTRFWVMNTYLVEEEDGLTLIDAGMSGSADSILAAAQQLGQPIRRILLTHAHTDHVGSLDALVQRLPEVEFLCSAQTARFLKEDFTLAPGQADTPLKGGFVRCTSTPTRTIQPGDQVGSLQVIAAPGHSPDQIAFLDTRDGTLYAGDAFQTQGGIAVSGDVRWRFPLPAWATWDKSTALETTKKLVDLNPSRLAVGHGPMLENPVSAMREAIARAERNFQ
ncbi:MAG: MBL fold metallo-hydrolase [Caldilineaceae bacterium]|nr:MBL fold metallo-hydrolase [Caldilineaceae bacterium]